MVPPDPRRTPAARSPDPPTPPPRPRRRLPPARPRPPRRPQHRDDPEASAPQALHLEGRRGRSRAGRRDRRDRRRHDQGPAGRPDRTGPASSASTPRSSRPSDCYAQEAASRMQSLVQSRASASPAIRARPTATGTAGCCDTSTSPTAGRSRSCSSRVGTARSTPTTARTTARPTTGRPSRLPARPDGDLERGCATPTAPPAGARAHGRHPATLHDQGQHRQRRRPHLPPARSAVLRRHRHHRGQG